MDNLENAERAALKQRQQQKWEAEQSIPVQENLKSLTQDTCGAQESTYNARTHLMHRLDHEIESLIRKIPCPLKLGKRKPVSNYPYTDVALCSDSLTTKCGPLMCEPGYTLNGPDCVKHFVTPASSGDNCVSTAMVGPNSVTCWHPAGVPTPQVPQK